LSLSNGFGHEQRIANRAALRRIDPIGKKHYRKTKPLLLASDALVCFEDAAEPEEAARKLLMMLPGRGARRRARLRRLALRSYRH
jgi:hypothetical protein